MCGLAGVLSSAMDDKKIELFRHLMVVATLRGQIGSGICAIAPGTYKTIRDPYLTAAELAYGADFYKYLKDTKPVCLMGHARAPTTGGYEVDDCHPIVGRHVIGMHNGTITHLFGKKLPAKEHDSRKFFESVDNNGLEKTVQGTTGAYCITMVNKQTQRLHILRNNTRTLSLAVIDDDPTTVFWASEMLMLNLVLKRSTTKAIKYYKLPVDTLLTFRLFFDGPVQHESAKTLVGATEEKKTSVPAVTNGFWFETRPPNRVSLHEMNAILRKGCCNCHLPYSQIDHEKKNLTWLTRNEYICRECLNMSQLARDHVTTSGLELPPDLPKLPPMH